MQEDRGVLKDEVDEICYYVSEEDWLFVGFGEG